MEKHGLKNNRMRIEKQLAQSRDVSYWCNHWGRFSIPTPRSGPSTYKGSMCPSGLALEHPVAQTLLNYASGGCPTNTGAPWTVKKMQAAIDCRPDETALDLLATNQLPEEVAEKERADQARTILWEQENSVY